ncbi:MAG: hypothetical protein HND57_09885 [Planctomycetes bacterium]|nr:hypothetical protein [Planctomycetota bacterium]
MHQQPQHLQKQQQREQQSGTNGSRQSRLPIQVMPVTDPAASASSAVPAAQSLTYYTDQPQTVVLAHLTWHVLPAALDTNDILSTRHLTPSRKDSREAVLGMTIIRKSADSDTPVYELLAWASVECDASDPSQRDAVFHHLTNDAAHRNGAVLGTVSIEASQADGNTTVAIRVEQNGQRVLALSRTVTPDGRTVDWAQSDLPERFNLGGGQYELHDMQIHPALLQPRPVA